MERVLLLHRKSHKHDAVRFPLFTIFVATIIYLLVDGLASPHWVVFNAFLKYGFSGDGLWFVGWWIFIALLALLFYGLLKGTLIKRVPIDKDEFLYLEGDELVHIGGKIKERVKVKDLREIVILANGLNYLQPQRWIRFKFVNPQDTITFGEGYELSMRPWITVDELIEKGIKIYHLLSKINSSIELKRIVPRKWRADNKFADVEEIYENGKWMPIKVIPIWAR